MTNTIDEIMAIARGERPKAELRTFTAESLQTMKFPPLNYLLPGLIPEGLCGEAAKLLSSEQTVNIDCPTELPHQKSV
jgi:hypothetical protein